MPVNIDSVMPGFRDDTIIVRYMKLETFLLLLSGKIYIPTLRQLRQGDRQESEAAMDASGDYLKKLGQRLEPHMEWLLAHSDKAYKIRPVSGGDHNFATWVYLIRVWLNEMEDRRRIWCWNWESDASHALWHL